MGKQNWEHIPLINNDSGDKKRFELKIDDQVAFTDYMISKQNIIYLTHTEVPNALEGQGVGSALVSKVLDHIKQTGLKMAPLCPFVAAYLKRHPEMADGLLAPGYSVG
ncbi:N-acetyltransferase [Flavobacteriaceae bacterium TP-CH-4]|uniref:N-acetyltransferase n=1 Tax=Pelagihabitans pacificus TaxID=2696054 RepID=A0A967AW85_9FLAO|nr:GNAT family N-acetyltransferase [Pelagihabitans pacificus]NHF60268.1 N-acetyltransferase [Pelagihabitans pacificus]